MYSPMTDLYRIFANIKDVNAILKSYFFQRQIKRIAKVICSVIILLDSPVAEAESESENLHVSATVIRSCGISSSPLTLRNLDSQVAPKINDIGIGNSLKISCHTSFPGTMALGIGANTAGNAVISVVANDNAGAENLNKAYLAVADEGKNSRATDINLGLFPVAGSKVILIHGDNLIGNHVVTGVDERTMTLFINF